MRSIHIDIQKQSVRIREAMMFSLSLFLSIYDMSE